MRSLTLVLGIAAIVACDGTSGVSNQSGTGGSKKTGGISSTGGSTTVMGGNTAKTGGATNNGGITNTGGTTNAGGATTGTGGNTSSTGGSVTNGGTNTNSGGAASSGGATNSSGGSKMGGSTSGAGDASIQTGGIAGTGGSSGGTIATTGGTVAGTGGSGSSATEIYASPTGSASNAGTEESPLDLPKALTVLGTGATKTLWLLPGTYKPTVRQYLANTGTAAAPLKIWAKSTRPVIDFSALPRNDGTSRGLGITGGYYHLKTLEVTKAGDNCIWISGHHNTIEDVIVHECQDTGIQITVGSADAGKPLFGSDNLVKNCDSYSNADATGENADGFAAKLRIGPGNVFTGCRAWNNSDDGWDLFAGNDVVTITNCWAFSNGYGSNGDGNGFKLGGASDGTADQGGAVHVVTGCVSVGNKIGAGYTQNNNSSMPKVSASFSAGNNGGDCKPTSMCPGLQQSTMSVSQLTNATRGADGSLPASK